ncbi:glycosyltransferase family 2 protein [Candidatus Saccharibacteria bacterium]|nr:glycosyltransferase family 2 protein [Candidatus Saccharibacteria bacterium]
MKPAIKTFATFASSTSYALTAILFLVDMANKPLTLSIVIPVFNEEDYIGKCLDSIARQTIMPQEVFVVDNNCTDGTVAIAKKYSFVKLLHEKRQHQVFAQATSFNASNSDILGRIDADSILPPDWTGKIIKVFEIEPKLTAVTSGADPYDVPLKWLGAAIFHGYIYLAGLIGGQRMLWGSNCAVRASGWRKIKHKVLMRGDIWEDYDMAFCLRRHGRIGYLKNNQVGVSFRAMHTNFKHHVSYQFRSVRTFYYRANPLRLALFVLLWLWTFPVYPLAAFDDWLLKQKTTNKKQEK